MNRWFARSLVTQSVLAPRRDSSRLVSSSALPRPLDAWVGWDLAWSNQGCPTTLSPARGNRDNPNRAQR
jgi:hypothetical protein